MERNTILSFFKSARNPGHRRQNVIFCISLILAMMVLFPLMGHAFEGSLEKDVQKDLEQGQAIVVTIQKKLQTGSSVSPEIAQLKKSVENIKISNLLMEERFKLRDEKVKSLGTKAVDRHEAMVKGYRKALTEYLILIDGLPSGSQESEVRSQERINKLKTLLDTLLPKRKRHIIGSLPYKHLNYPAIEPSTAPEITPAYKGGNKTVSPDDTKSTPEAPISKEIAALAQSLNWQPVAIYEHVKNTVETEWYWGCQKGAEETLRQKSGNDCDQALLLSSLLKASGFPTRLVRGNIQFFASDDKPMERIKNLIGIDDPAKMAEFFQKAGIPYKPIIAGGKIANFEIEHIWIESLIPMANYRGAVIDEHGKTWIGLDTSIKVKGYEYNQPQDIFENAALSSQLSAIRDEYLGLASSGTGSTPFELNQTPLEYLKSAINSGFLTLNSQLTYSDFLRIRTLIPEVMNILPSSTQFTLIKATNEYTSIPDELVHKVKLSAVSDQRSANTDKLFDITLPLYQLGNQQVAITYEPETVEDQEIIDSYGGLDNTPSYLVRLRPVLKINGERIVVATDGLPMGADYTLTMELYSPSVNEGATPVETITNTMITGNLTVISITAGKAMTTPSPLAGEGGGEGEGEKDAERLLYESAQHYIDRGNQSEDELASLFHLSIARPLPTVVALAGMIDVTYLLDMPHGFTWKGVYVDADLRRVEAVVSAQQSATSGQLTAESLEPIKLFMQLSSLQGSILENRIFEDDFQVESISTAKLFQLISQPPANSYQLFTIDKTNIDAILPTLSCDDTIKEDITNAVNQNYTIKIPESEITYHDWTGTGYMKENIETGESGWMLSGGIAGGCPVDAVWLETHFQNTLSQPYAGIVNNDPLSAAWLRKIAATDQQRPIAVVNSVLPKPLAVFVADVKGTPVPNASVTFKIIAGGGKLQCLNAVGENEGPLSEANCTTTSGANGIAQAKLTLGKSTDANPEYIMLNPGDEFSTQIGLNLVTATASGYSGELSLDQPFAQYAKPEVPNKIVKLNGDGAAWYVNNPVGSLRVKVLDQYDNVVSNVTVTFSAQTAESLNPSIPLPTLEQGFRNIEFYKSDECNLPHPEKHVVYPLYGDCKTYYSPIDVKTGYFGAIISAVLGNTVNTKYTVQATAQGIQVPEEFTLTSYGHRNNADGYFSPSLQITHFELYNGQGELVNAAKVGTELKAPLTAALALYSCETTTEGPYQCTINNQQTNCWKVTSNGIIKTKKIIDGTVTFTPKDGNGLVTATTITNGQYQTQYTTGVTPAKNTIEAFGEAEVSVPEVFYDTANDWSASRTEVPVDKVVTVKSGQVIVFEKDSGQAHTGICGVDPVTDQVHCAYDTGQYEKVIYTVFGVNAALTIEPEIVLLNDESYSTVDTTFKYTILPPEYNAIIADVDIYKSGENNADEWINYIPGDKTQGQGTASFVQGSKFDINTHYKAQVLLNRGTDIEITSTTEINSDNNGNNNSICEANEACVDKVTIPVAQIKVLTYEYPEKIAEEIKFGTGADQYEWQKKKIYHINMQSTSLINNCENLTGKISIVNQSGQLVTLPNGDGQGYAAEYQLKGDSMFNGCRLQIVDTLANSNQNKFIISNRSRAALDEGCFNFNVSDKAVLYGGIGNQVEIEINGSRKYVPIEPVGVIVLGIDGLRQDVLYSVEEQHVNELHVDYYVQPSELKGLCDVLGGKFVGTSCDATGWENKHIKVKDVTAIFPSITLASWASVFTGKMPNETGITGNEFFARDLTFSEPARFNNPMGMITYDSGAFKGYDAFPKTSMLLDNDFLIPSRFYWTNALNPFDSPQNGWRMLPVDTVFETITGRAEGLDLPALPGMTNVMKYFQGKGGDPVVVANNHYARGARWMTWWLDLSSGLDEILDQQSWTRFKEYLEGRYNNESNVRNTVPFSALTVWYLPGLDHIAHVEGMGAYKDYFKTTTDEYIGSMVQALKALEEFENKIFVIVADHGHTAMPTGLTYKDRNWRGIDVDKSAEMSCEQKLDFIDRNSLEHVTSAQKAEKANNNLHIWEIGEVFKAVGKKGWGQYKVLAPKEIAEPYLIKDKTTNKIIELPCGATAIAENADVIVGLNGPMAHVYLTDINKLGKIAELFRLTLDEHPSEAIQWWNVDDLDYSDFKINTIGRLNASVDKILVRMNGNYCVFDGLNEDGSVNCAINETLTSLAYVDPWTRINGLNHIKRSGDIVLIMHDATLDNATDRYTTGVACKSWHGSLNPSDSYVPFIFAYPGGNKTELEKMLKKDEVCGTDYSNCKANWKLPNIIKEIISEQYK